MSPGKIAWEGSSQRKKLLVHNVEGKAGDMNPVWLQRAIRNVESNLGSVVTEEHTAEEVNEEIFTLAFDAAGDAGADEESAGAIADHIRKTMGINL